MSADTGPVNLDVKTLPLDGRQLIEASAGTGKTWTLTQLVMRLVLERGLQPRQILVVTYTEAATAELKERIRAELSQRLRADALDDTQRRQLSLALQDFDEAAIFTIHGFCRQALSELPFTAGAPLALEVLQDESALRLQVTQDHWRERVASAAAQMPPGAAAAVAAMLLQKKDSPERWEQQLRRAQGHAMVRWEWPDGMDAAGLDNPAAQAGLLTLLQTLQQHFDAARATWQTERERVVQIMRAALPHLNGSVYKPPSLEQAFIDWDELLSAASPLQAGGKLDKLHLLGSARMKPKQGKPPPEPHPFFGQAQAVYEQREALLAADSPLMLARLWLLRELLEQGPATMAAHKRQRRLQSFDDMLGKLHRSLQGPRGRALAAALRKRFPAALIDEFQDTDGQQAAIFDAIYGEHPACPLLMLGDPKQAIYGFRGADLHTYLQARSTADAQHTLTHNQRSTPALLDALNALYAGHPRAFVIDGLHYTPVSAGVKVRPELCDESGLLGDAALALWLLPNGADGQPLPKGDAQQRCAEASAEHIAALLTEADLGRITLDGRALAGGDVAVLVRSHREGALMRQALAGRGVASVELSRQSVHASSEAMELQLVLAAMLEPQRAPRLHAALATLLMGCDASTLLALQQDDAALQAVIESFHAHHLRWQQRGVGVMLRHWMTEGVTARLLALPDGQRRLTNLLHLAERMQQHEQAAPGSPAAQLRWLHREGRRALEGSDGDGDRDATLLRLESDRQLVQIVTLHRAKGLEYPVVFMPFAWDMDPPPGRLEGLAYHDDDGRAVLDYRSPEKDDPRKQRIKLEGRAEAMRLLYVGLTRAVHRCVLGVGCYRSRKSTKQATRSALNSLVAGGGNTPAQWLDNALEPADIDAAWHALARRESPHISLLELPVADAAVHYRAPAPAPERLAALPAPEHIAPPWTLASYSSLWLNLRHERAAADHDLLEEGSAEVAAADDGRPPAPMADDDFLNFPRGAAAGEALHAVFERIDFTHPEGWPAVVEDMLAQHQPGGDETPPSTQAARVLTMLRDVLNTPLPGAAGHALRLNTVANTRRLVEMEFCLSAARLDLRELGQLTRRAGLGEPSLTVSQLDGYLRGFIDLVFEHDGRWWIVDWKSNHLGAARADYDGKALTHAMQVHGYTFQALLYAVALHRWLGRRLSGYEPARHFGGVHYLFLRGMKPDWPGCGVHTWQPDAGLLEGVSALFTAEGP